MSKIDFNQVITAEEKQALAQAQMVNTYRIAVDQHIENTAMSKDYNSASHCATYVNSTITEWMEEAKIFIAWRDSVWLFVYDLFSKIKAGQATPPGSTEIMIEMLPKINW